jgi:hypothetical protein
MPSLVDEVIAAPPAQPSVPAPKKDYVEQVVIGVITVLLAEAILWHVHTGQWVFERLLIYLIQQLD